VRGRSTAAALPGTIGSRGRVNVAILALVAWPLLLESSAAIAEEATEPIRLTYQASDGCPDEDGFVARVLARTGRVRPAWRGEAARSFLVTARAGPPASGQVTIRQEDGRESSRVLQGETCTDVVDAMALVAALAVDPRARVSPMTAGAAVPAPSAASSAASAPGPTPAPTAAPSAAASAPTPAPQSLPGAQEVAPPPRGPAVSREAEAGPARGSSPEPRSVDAPSGRSVFVGGDFAVATGVTTGALLAGSPFIGWRADRRTWLDPSVRVAFLRATSGTIDVVDGASANFTWTVGRVDGCPVASPGWPVRATACARIEAGTIEGRGFGIARATDKLLPWLAAGLLLRLEWALPWRVFVDAEAGGLVRVVATEFVFKPDIVVDQVPVVGVSAGVGLGFDFL